MALLSARKMARMFPGVGERNFARWAKRERDPLPSYMLGRGRYYDPDEFMPWLKRQDEGSKQWK